MRTALIALVVAISAYAAAGEPNALPPGWSFDRFLIGAWKCDLTRPGKALAHEDAVYSLGLNDRWLKLTYKLTTAADRAVTTDAYESFDPKLKMWAYTSFRDDGDYGTAYSRGWIGNSKTYLPPADSKEHWRLIQTKLNDGHFVEVVEIGNDKGRWERVSELRCRKTP